MLEADVRGVSFHYEIINDTIQYKEAEFVLPPCCNMKESSMQTLSYLYKCLNILLEAEVMGWV